MAVVSNVLLLWDIQKENNAQFECYYEKREFRFEKKGNEKFQAYCVGSGSKQADENGKRRYSSQYTLLAVKNIFFT